MSDEPTTMDWLLHITRGHTSTEDWEKRNSWQHHCWSSSDELLVNAAPKFREEVIRLRALLNGIVDIALKQTLLNDDNPPMVNILNIAYEGVVE
jgi:glycosidase